MIGYQAMSAVAVNAGTRRARFPRNIRLLRHADFQRVYKQGRRHFAANMTVFYLPRAEGRGMRIGFTVSRALGGAVARNRIRRRLREAVRLQENPVIAAMDIVINPKKSLLHAQFADLQEEIRRAFDLIQNWSDVMHKRANTEPQNT
ncbi:MAG: ribonuclease P protein component [Acidobacteriales bacterium]|nr:ribonuclease P protein component [Terriglobales bacterium]